jgi:hypothetical protein
MRALSALIVAAAAVLVAPPAAAASRTVTLDIPGMACQRRNEDFPCASNYLSGSHSIAGASPAWKALRDSALAPTPALFFSTGFLRCIRQS